jgi:hypothetical protein
MARIPVWSEAARADIRALDRATAIQLLQSFGLYLTSGAGDVKQLKGRENEFR